jgi:hypothetical protein
MITQKEINNRKKYLREIEEQIAIVTQAGNDRIVDLQREIDAIERQKADLLKQVYKLKMML